MEVEIVYTNVKGTKHRVVATTPDDAVTALSQIGGYEPTGMDIAFGEAYKAVGGASK